MIRASYLLTAEEAANNKRKRDERQENGLSVNPVASQCNNLGQRERMGGGRGGGYLSFSEAPLQGPIDGLAKEAEP